MKSKQRPQKVFYLPLEYQIFFQPSNMSTAVFPYTIQCLKKLNANTHFIGCNFYAVSNNNQYFLLRKSTHIQRPRNIFSEITRLVQDINPNSILSKHFSVYKKSVSFWRMDDSEVMFVQSINSSSTDNKRSKINEGASTSRELKGSSGSDIICVQSVHKKGKRRNYECEPAIKKIDKNDVVFLQSVNKDSINNGKRKNNVVTSKFQKIHGDNDNAVIFVKSISKHMKRKKNEDDDFTIRYIDSNDVVFLESVHKNCTNDEKRKNIDEAPSFTIGDAEIIIDSIQRNSANTRRRISTNSFSPDDVTAVVEKINGTDHQNTKNADSINAMKSTELVAMDGTDHQNTVYENSNTAANVGKRKNSDPTTVNDDTKVSKFGKTFNIYPDSEKNVMLGNNQGSMSGQSLRNNNCNNPSSSICPNLIFNFSHNMQFNNNSSNIESNMGHTLGHNSCTKQTELEIESGPNEVKIMSYNILAQTLLRRHQNLYGHSDRKFLIWEFRLKNIINEILAYNCDIVCLQEVEESYLECLTSKLVDYKYVYKKRTGPNVDGCCTFYKHSKYALVKSKMIEYFISENHEVMNKHNIGVILCLRTTHHNIIVGNTHLLYNPRRSDVRYEQCKFLLRQIQHVHDSLPENTPVVITGDFNSEPNAGLVNYILRNKSYFKWESAYDPKSHVVSTYHDYWCLKDYIFYTNDNLKLLDKKVLPHHRKRPISRIPNQDEGSDHLSLVAKFAFA